MPAITREKCCTNAASQIVRMQRRGVGVVQIVEQAGLGWTAVNTAPRLHRDGSLAMRKPGIRGNKPGSGLSLTLDQGLTVRQTVCAKRPELLKMDFAE